MLASAPVQFRFDFSSPESYLASTWIEPQAARHGRAVQWRAVLRGAALEAAELPPPASYPVKGPYMLHDDGHAQAERWLATGPF